MAASRACTTLGLEIENGGESCPISNVGTASSTTRIADGDHPIRSHSIVRRESSEGEPRGYSKPTGNGRVDDGLDCRLGGVGLVSVGDNTSRPWFPAVVRGENESSVFVSSRTMSGAERLRPKTLDGAIDNVAVDDCMLSYDDVADITPPVDLVLNREYGTAIPGI